MELVDDENVEHSRVDGLDAAAAHTLD